MIVEGYTEFAGNHWETGSVRNVLAYLGVRAPHSGQPYTEAMLLGLANGISVQVTVVDPQEGLPTFSLETHHPFKPVRTLIKRLRIPAAIKTTNSPQRAYANLLDTLRAGVPALVWADRAPFDYAEQAASTGMQPLVVYGVDESIGAAYVADRADVALAVSLEQLAAGRAAQVNVKHLLIQLADPDIRFFKLAVQEAIAACVALYTEDPPKGPAVNFGLKALDRWTDTLLSPRGKRSWARLFPPGPALFSAMTAIYEQVQHIPAQGAADRGLYADFLAEAAEALDEPVLMEASLLFRECAALWVDLAEALLPAGDELWGGFPQLAEAKLYLDRIHELFTERGGDSLEERIALRQKLADLQTGEFPFDEDYAEAYRAELAQRLRGIHGAEQAAVDVLKAWLTS